MAPFGLLALSAFFAYLAFDAHQFERTSRHQIWAIPPQSSDRAVGVDPLSISEQAGLQSSKFAAVGGIPGLYWVFVVLSIGCLGAAAWLWLG